MKLFMGLDLGVYKTAMCCVNADGTTVVSQFEVGMSAFRPKPVNRAVE